MLGRGALNTHTHRSQREQSAAAGFQKSHSAGGFVSARVSPASFSLSFAVSVSRPVPARPPPPADRFTARHARGPRIGYRAVTARAHLTPVTKHGPRRPAIVTTENPADRRGAFDVTSFQTRSVGLNPDTRSFPNFPFEPSKRPSRFYFSIWPVHAVCAHHSGRQRRSNVYRRPGLWASVLPTPACRARRVFDELSAGLRPSRVSGLCRGDSDDDEYTRQYILLYRPRPIVPTSRHCIVLLSHALWAFVVIVAAGAGGST